MADAQTKLGQLIEGEVQRDAVHIAVAPVVSNETLQPGTHVGLVAGKASTNVFTKDRIGIVDPFLGKAVKKGERFYLFLYPNTITSLKHIWTHPAFMVEDSDKVVIVKSKKESETWLRNFIDNSDCPSYDAIVGAVLGETRRGDDYTIDISEDYVNVYGSDAHGEIPPEFWDHMEVVTGVKITKRPEYFSCSC